MANNIKNIIGRLVLYFVPKKIVYSKFHPPGLLVKAFEDTTGKRYLKIAVTNHAIPGQKAPAIIYLIPRKNVIGIRNSTTPFKRWWYLKVLKTHIPNTKLKAIK